MTAAPSLRTRVIDGVEYVWTTCGRCSGTGSYLRHLILDRRCERCHGLGQRWEVPFVSPCLCCAASGCGCDAMEPEGPDCLFELCSCCLDRFCECQGGVTPELVFVAPSGGVVLDLTLEKE